MMLVKDITNPAGVSLDLEQVEVNYGGGAVLADFSLGIAPGELFGLIGPSGCGKSTTLGVIAGFIPIERGNVRLGGRDVTGLPSQKREVGVVFQNYALFPHMTAAENIGYGLRVSHDMSDYDARIQSLLDLVKLSAKGGRLPRELSGGEQQRVAIARALAIRPKVLLLDEPLSNLDARLRGEMQEELRRIQREASVTTIFVTHDQDEAFAVCDRVAIMNLGRIEQLGRPRDLYRSPATRFVARFIGKSSKLQGRAAAANTLEIADAQVRTATPMQPGRTYELYLRPEDISIGAAVHTDNRFEGRVTAMLEAGPHRYYTVRFDGGEVQVMFSARAETDFDLSAPVWIGWPAQAGALLEGSDG
ncbi:MAG: ABC transporter ATP-binding protein [Chelatococcus sp.]|nr:ABC transporter ATP-binding protein [Chelatococcus sp. HY11]MBX3545964.1 ABC transporter ATP-binding protein [Chelatococcus sp.]